MGQFEEVWASQRVTPSPRQVTPLYLVEDMESAQRRFGAMGFEAAETSNQGCARMKAGDSQILLVDEIHAQKAMPREVLPSFKHGPALYVWVDSIDETRARISDPVIAEMVTGYGTWELFVESRVGLIIFAEKLTRDASSNPELS